jgi:hypothetical protein
MTSFFERQAKRVLGRFGFEARSLAPLDTRAETDHPIAAAYLGGSHTCLIEVSLSNCRGVYGFPFTLCHPFVRTALAYVEGRVATYRGSPLETYYGYFQPKDAGDLFALPGPPSALHEVAPYAFAWPWESISVLDRAQKRLARTEVENERRGARLPLSHGYSGYGPVSEQKGTIEFLALARLVESIQHSGYVRTDQFDGDIRAVPLIDKAFSVRYLLRSGQHRAAVLAALGFERIPVVINFTRPVRADEVDYWPHVRDRLFTRDQALFLFDGIFAGYLPSRAIPPAWCEENSAMAPLQTDPLCLPSGVTPPACVGSRS